ncbi:hypothetical protein C8R44DRAFT_745631 [Mycena epipterygia]|nr:hypothetical protein C8R44DRAFT_745631 [Mycena epipterygia]
MNRQQYFNISIKDFPAQAGQERHWRREPEEWHRILTQEIDCEHSEKDPARTSTERTRGTRIHARTIVLSQSNLDQRASVLAYLRVHARSYYCASACWARCVQLERNCLTGVTSVPPALDRQTLSHNAALRTKPCYTDSALHCTSSLFASEVYVYVRLFALSMHLHAGDKQAKWPAVKFFNFTSAVYLLAKETAIYISLPNAS